MRRLTDPSLTVLADHANPAAAASTTTPGITRGPSGHGHTVATAGGHHQAVVATTQH
jgi:hypothetical protein